MVEYRVMDQTCPVVSCLHSGVISLEDCQAASNTPAYVEAISDIPAGSVARILTQLGERYGASGVVALDEGMVVGKIRCYPQAITDLIPELCLQTAESTRRLLELDLDSISADRDVLHIHCIQVAKDYCGQGIAGEMLDAVIGWACAEGWKELQANTIMDIYPLLAWSGQLSRGALERRGFSLVSSRFYPELHEGVVSQRTGAHGVDVQRQWEEYAHVSDDEASFMFDMKLAL